MNIAFFVPALVGTVLGLLLVKTNLPPTPPSASEEQQRQTENNNLKKLVSSQTSERNKQANVGFAFSEWTTLGR